MMSDEEKDIRDFLAGVREADPGMRFKCGFGTSGDTYIVEVESWEGAMDKEPYSRMEYDFVEAFEKKYPYFMILFVPKGDMVGIARPLFTVGYEEAPSCTSGALARVTRTSPMMA